MPNSTLAISGHPPQPARRVGFIDRTALRIGIALVSWSRRPVALDSRERRAARIEQQLAVLQREEHWSKLHKLRF
jgi:hypothetical protein